MHAFIAVSSAAMTDALETVMIKKRLNQDISFLNASLGLSLENTSDLSCPLAS